MKNFRSVVMVMLLGAGLVMIAPAQQKKAKPLGVVVGTLANGHNVTLTWTNSTTTGVQGYNIYRGTAPGGEGTTPINGSTLVQSGYVDQNVTGLSTYYYTAKASCSTCSPTLSVASNEVQAVIPADAQPAAPVMNTPTAQ